MICTCWCRNLTSHCGSTYSVSVRSSITSRILTQATVITTFHANVRQAKMREKLNTRKVRTVAELFELADKCARAEEGRKIPGVDTADSGEKVGTSSGADKRKNRKRKTKAVLAVESSGKKTKANNKGKGKAAEADPGSPYCKIHLTSDHDIQECWQVEYLAKKQKKEYERRDREKKAKGEAGDSKKKDGKIKKQKERPARGRDKKEEDEADDDDEEEEEETAEFQKAEAVACVHGGASLYSSHRKFKKLSREVNVVQPTVEAQRPLKWSQTPITFDAGDHPDRISGVGLLPMLVAPTIGI